MRLACTIAFVCAAMPVAFATEPGDPERGLAYARIHCSGCHAVERGQYAGIYVEVPSFREIATTPGISELALISFFQTPHPSMPDFMVPSADISDLIAYILSLKD